MSYPSALKDADIFTRFTTTYIEQTGDLKILAICRGCKTRETTTLDDPSWVIDYRDYYSGTPEFISWRPEFISWRPGEGEWSAGGNDHRCTPVIDGNLFGAQGYEFDSVLKVSSVSRTGRKKVNPSYITAAISSFVSAAGFSRFYLDAKKISSEANPESKYRHGGNTGITTLEAFWQTLRTSHGPTELREPNELPRDKKIREGVDRLLTLHAGLVTIDNWAGFLFSIALYLVVLIMTGLETSPMRSSLPGLYGQSKGDSLSRKRGTLASDRVRLESAIKLFFCKVVLCLLLLDLESRRVLSVKVMCKVS